MPLAIGNQWEYEYIFYNDDGTVYGVDTSEFTLNSSFVKDGETLYFSPIPFAGFLTAYTNRPDGLWTYNEMDLIPSFYAHNVFYPFKVDSAISFTFIDDRFTDSLGNKFNDTILSTYTLVNDNLQKTVGAGTFNCLKYVTEDSNLTRKRMEMRIVEFYALNVGLIYREEYEGHLYRPLKLISQKSLLSYKLY
ncbi:MAG TPA: hypothetical protein VIX80_02960 [Candidatus Kapabacteria bacterium]